MVDRKMPNSRPAIFLSIIFVIPTDNAKTGKAIVLTCRKNCPAAISLSIMEQHSKVHVFSQDPLLWR